MASLRATIMVPILRLTAQAKFGSRGCINSFGKKGLSGTRPLRSSSLIPVPRSFHSRSGKSRSRQRRLQVKKRVILAVVFVSFVVGLVVAAQDKYTVQVPGGLAFSEFRGYEQWQAISTSGNEQVVAVIL